MIVLATDAPRSQRNLRRLAERTSHGVARTGSSMAHGSGDYAIALSTDRGPAAKLEGALMTVLFGAAMEATEEAVLNSLFAATTTVGFRGRVVRALPVDEVLQLLRSAER